MTKVSTEMPSKAQQSCAGANAAKPFAGGFATAGGVARITGADGTLAGCSSGLHRCFHRRIRNAGCFLPRAGLKQAAISAGR